MDELRTKLADYAHEAWAGWMRWLFDRAHTAPDGSVTISAGYAAALRRQMTTLYIDLSQAEKDADLAEADKMLALIEASGEVSRLRARADEWANAAISETERASALGRERDGLRLALVATSEQGDTLARDLDTCRADRSLLAAARAWVRQHGQHPPSCAAARGERCTCGLDELRG